MYVYTKWRMERGLCGIRGGRGNVRRGRGYWYVVASCWALVGPRGLRADGFFGGVGAEDGVMVWVFSLAVSTGASVFFGVVGAESGTAEPDASTALFTGALATPSALVVAADIL